MHRVTEEWAHRESADGSIARRTRSRCTQPPRAATSALTKCAFSWKFALKEFPEVRRHGVLGSTHGPGPVLIIPTNALWALLERALRREAKGASGSSSTFRKRMLTSPQMLCRLAEAANRGVPKCSLTGCRRAPGAHSPQQDDPGRRDAEFDPLGALPAFLPARVAADLWVEPDAGAFRL
jgi:hypothetical protein